MSMRISTLGLYQNGVDNMALQQRIVGDLQSKISSGKRIMTASDDPSGATRVSNLHHELSKFDQFINNASLGKFPLEYEDSVLNSISHVYQRLYELTVYAGDASLAPIDLHAIAIEMQERLEELVDLANTRDATGDYIFSGFKVKIPAVLKTEEGNYLFQGDEGQKEILMGPSMSVILSDSGKELFFELPTARLKGQGEAGLLNTGDGTVSSVKVITSPSFPLDETYTISFNNDGTFDVKRDSNGELLLEAVLYEEGKAFSFGGIEVVLEGTPEDSDEFAIWVEEIPRQDVFTTVQNIIKNITENNKEYAQLSYEIDLGLMDLSFAQEQLLKIRVEVGARLNTIDSQKDFNESLKLFTQSNLSFIEDLDYTSAISQLTLNSFILQAAQQSFVRIQSLSIFNFL